MKKSRFPEAEIMGVLRQSDRGRVATEWLWTYNNERPNMGIGGLAPAKKMKMVA